jgi:hypothetical protein
VDRLRVPFFAAAAFFMLLALLVEIAASEWLARLTAGTLDKVRTPGIAIHYLAIMDGIIVYSVIWMALGLILPRGITGRTQGIVTLIVSILALLGTIALAFAAFTLLMLMIALLVAAPFGTIAYFAEWGHFAVKAAAATLMLAMLLKILFCIFLVLAHQRFLQNKGLVILTAVSLGLTWVTAFVQSFLPGFLVSIGDAAVALVIAIVGAVWLLLLALGSLIATVKAILSLGRV